MINEPEYREIMATHNNTNATRVGFVGLGAMGFGMACNLLRKPNFNVQGYDVYPPSAERFAAQGGRTGQCPKEVAANSDFLICMAANAQQIDDILFSDETGALRGESARLKNHPVLAANKRTKHCPNTLLLLYALRSLPIFTRHYLPGSLKQAEGTFCWSTPRCQEEQKGQRRVPSLSSSRV